MRKRPSILLLILPTSIGFAQGTTSRISGTVTDTSGAAVPSASVIAVNDDTGIVYNTKTSSSGTYSFDSLQLGKYTIRAEAPGFQQFVSTGNVLSIGVPTSVDPRLEAGGNSETVTIQGGYDMVQTESSGNFGAIIDNERSQSRRSSQSRPQPAGPHPVHSRRHPEQQRQRSRRRHRRERLPRSRLQLRP